MNAPVTDILTPEQAVGYLQVNRETIYRYIRDGKLAASRLGRGYRITRHSLDLLLAENRVRPAVPLRTYSDQQLANFLEADQFDAEAHALILAFRERAQARSAHER